MGGGMKQNIIIALLALIFIINAAGLWLLGSIQADSERYNAQRVTEIYHQQFDVAASGPVYLPEDVKQPDGL